MGEKVEIKDLSFSYQGKGEQLEGINLNIKDGECLAVIGRSGCGKSTLTRVVNGLIPSFFEGKLDGSVRIDGDDIKKFKSWEFAKLVGNVFQDPRSQFFANEVAGEIAFGPENLGLTSDEIKKRVNKASERMHIEDIFNTRIYNLSYGMRQKVAISSAKAINPSIYVFDEPSANLDLEAIYKFRKLICDLKEEGKTILIVEHKLFYLNGIVDRYVLLKDGRVDRTYQRNEFEKLSSKKLNEMSLRSINLNDINVPKSEVFKSNVTNSFELKNIRKRYKKQIV